MRPSQRSRAAKLLSLLLVAPLLLVALPAGSAYAPNTNADGRELEPNPAVRGNVTIIQHKPSCETNVLCFHDDSDGKRDLKTYGLTLNPLVTEPIQFKPQSIDCQYYGEDATSEAAKKVTSAWCGNITSSASPGLAWLDAAQWTTSGTEANDTIVTETRNGVHMLRLRNPGGTDSTVTDLDTYTLNFPDITTDVAKMRLIIGFEYVGALSSTYSSVLIDVADGNNTGYKTFRIKGGTAADGVATPPTLANTTGVVFWDELVTDGDTVQGGVTDDIGKISIGLQAQSGVGATEVYIYALGLQTKRYEFGVDDTGSPVYNMTYTGCDGKARATPLGSTCLAQFAPNFVYQTARDLKIAYELKASGLANSKVSIISQEINDATYTWKSNYRFNFNLPSFIDLAWAGDEALTYMLPVAGKQHELVKASTVDKLTDVKSKALGAEVVLQTGPPVGKEFEVEMTIFYTDLQMRDITQLGFLGLPASNPFSKVWVWLSGLAVVGLGFAKLIRRSRKGS